VSWQRLPSEKDRQRYWKVKAQAKVEIKRVSSSLNLDLSLNLDFRLLTAYPASRMPNLGSSKRDRHRRRRRSQSPAELKTFPCSPAINE